MDWIAAADLVVHPALCESWCQVLFEALGFTKPILMTPVGAAPEVIGNNERGRLIPPGDSGAIADAIIELMDDRELGRSLAESGRAYIYLIWALTARREIMKSYIMRRCGKFPNGFDRRFGHQTEKCMSCPLCDHQFSKPSWIGSTFYRGKEFTYFECLFCNSLYCDPMPDGETLSQMYGADYQNSFVDEAPDDGSREGRRIIELLKEMERGYSWIMDAGPDLR